ncbi:MAG: hypothetical protein KDB94_04190, partial [Acidobacteria bacterium]|nr:hypothetical protein [Acidobacteriota bacterium]
MSSDDPTISKPRAADDDTQPVPFVVEPRSRRPVGPGRAARAHVPPWQIVAGIAVALIALLAVALLLRGGGSDDDGATPPPASATPEPLRIVATLADRPGPISLRSDGEVDGIEAVSPNVRRRVAETLESGQLPPSPEMERLGGVAGDLAAAGLDPVAPLGVLVSEERPVLRWRRGEEAPRDVVVEILDGSGVTLAESPHLTGSEWRPPRALPRGRPLLWRLRYRDREGDWREVPEAPFGGVRFALLRGEELAWREREVAASHGSLLVAAVLSAQLGALEEARTALLDLARLNSGEPLVGRLLTDLERRQ